MNNCFYQYKIKVNWDGDPFSENEDLLSGIVPAYSLVDAVKILEDHYGEDVIQEIQMLKPIIEGPVFEFNLIVNEDNFDFDYQIIEKDKKHE